MLESNLTSVEQLDQMLHEGRISQKDYDLLRGALDAHETQESARDSIVHARRLVRRREGRLLGGVCTGVADYFGVDVWRVRVVFLLALLFSAGTALLVYVPLCVLLPVVGEDNAPPEKKSHILAFAVTTVGLWILNVWLYAYHWPKLATLLEDYMPPLPGSSILVINIADTLFRKTTGVEFQAVLVVGIVLLYLILPQRPLRRALAFGTLAILSILTCVYLWAYYAVLMAVSKSL